MVVNGLLNSNGFIVLTTNYNQVFCGGKVKLVGSVPSAITSTGRVPYTIERKAVGVYWVNFNTPYPSTNFTPSVSIADNYAYSLFGGNTSSTKLEVVTFSASSVNVDASFYFSVF